MSVRLRRLTLVLPIALAMPAAVIAQDAPASARAILRGTIQDLTGAPLEGAEIEVLGAGRKATTPASGTYRLSVPEGRSWVIVRRIGFEPLRVALTFEAGQDRRITFQLDRVPQQLANVTVTAEKIWRRRYEDFVWRSRSAWGRFLTRDDIAEARPAVLSDLVRRYLPGVSPRAFDWATVGLSHASQANPINCAPAVSLNGAAPFGTWAVNDFAPDDVEAIEVYRRGRDVPLEFQRSVSAGGSCGLVVIWLK